MEIKDLNKNDQAVLVALLHKIILSDKKATPEEVAHLDDIIDEMGEAAYNEHAEKVEELWGEGAHTKAFLLSVQAQEARDLIYGTVVEVALEDGVDGAEEGLLEWLKENWYIKEEFVQ